VSFKLESLSQYQCKWRYVLWNYT